MREREEDLWINAKGRIKKNIKEKGKSYFRAKDSQWNYTGNSYLLKGFWTLCLNKEKC